ncbi:aldolase [Rhizobiales bacterium]|uniref:aldolase n=1 Tax=Hongsoonwoonella zoysiae TaxID=2821844 RepID=UPI0015615D82|nr:aldolase [Hongsoonwoonella zoysiae]NRG19805.1 aldolase [Hongsoonwoonella zoysiae]
MAIVAEYRRELAAVLRLAAHFDLNEGICNHFSVAIPGDDERYLINPYGIHWSQMQPEDLMLIDGEGTVLEGEGEVEATARNIHIASHRANPRHLCILHTHMPYATALTMLENGRLEMAHQTACRYFGRIAYDDQFGGIALDEEEGRRIAEQAKQDPNADIIFLANHGVVVGGPSVPHAFDDLYYLERAARQQVLAQSTGRPLKIIPDDVARETSRQFMQVFEVQAIAHFNAMRRVIGL